MMDLILLLASLAAIGLALIAGVLATVFVFIRAVEYTAGNGNMGSEEMTLEEAEFILDTDTSDISLEEFNRRLEKSRVEDNS